MENYMTINELADYLKVAVQTLRKWVLNREIPFHKIKGVIRFRVSEIEKWINDGVYPMSDEPHEDVEIISLDELAAEELAGELPEDENDD